MEEEKSSVVEKRVSKGIIRRRARPDAPAQAETPEESPKAQAEVPAVVQAQPAQEQEAATAKEVVAKPAVPAVKAPATVIKRVHAASGNAQDIVAKNLGLNKKVETKAVDPAPAVTQVAPQPAPAKEPEKQPEPQRPLTFRDRIRGTITLDKLRFGTQIKPQAKTEKTDATKAVPGAVRVPGAEAEETDESGAKKDFDKAAKVKKGTGVKVIGGDLDIEGLGRATNLGQIVRTFPSDRVFRPGSSAGGLKKKKIVSKKSIKSTLITEKAAHKRVIDVHNTITVGNLAHEMSIKAGDIIKYLMGMGMMVTMNHPLDFDTASLVANEFNYQVKNVAFDEKSVLETHASEAEDPDAMPRAPVVTVMGHVDHGKTSLLDAIRSTNVTEGEAGGITQHIGAYSVSLPQGEVTFLDTPGHEAFTAIRARGSQVTDIVILVVAADDGVMPQTLESIDHAKAAGVPIIVAVNKMDKEGADPDRVTRQLSEKGLLSEAWGGDTMFVPVSALKRTGIKELLEGVLLQAEVLELKANPKKRASGTVIEAKLDRARGPLCTLLVQNGTLRVGDPVVVGAVAGKVRALTDWRGQNVTEAGPSMAVEILGLENVAEAGEKFHVVESEQDAKQVAAHRAEQKKQTQQAGAAKVSLEDMFSQIKAGKASELNIILKTDVQGSLEAVRDAILKLGTDDVKSKIVSTGVGGITESDVVLASTTQSIIIGFNVRPETSAIHSAKEKGVDIRMYKIIYDLINDVKLAMQGLLAPTRKETYLGRAEVKQAFEVSKLGFIAGSLVADGVITRNANLRLLRDNVVIFEGKVCSLKRFKDDAREVKKGLECGIGIEGFRDIRAGDVIEAFTVEMVERTL